MEQAEELHDGCCEFCGQVVQYDNKTLREAKMDQEIAAKLICDCTEAKIFQKRRKNIMNGVKRVDEIVGKDAKHPASDEVVNYLHHAVVNIVNYKMQKVTVNISSREKVSVAATKKGIKVSREIKETQDSETEMLI